MNIFNKIFGTTNTQSKPTKIRQVNTGIDDFVYLVDYQELYGEVLAGYMNDKVLAELYLFRAWTTQFGFRIFSSKPDISEQLITQTVTYSMQIGQKIFHEKHLVNIEQCLGDSYMNLLDSRWQSYDLVFIQNKNGNNFAAPQIIGRLMQYLSINDPVIALFLEGMFSAHLLAVKERSRSLGLF